MRKHTVFSIEVFVTDLFFPDHFADFITSTAEATDRVSKHLMHIQAGSFPRTAMDGLVKAESDVDQKSQQIRVNRTKLFVNLRRERQDLRPRQQGRNRGRALIQEGESLVESVRIFVAKLSDRISRSWQRHVENNIPPGATACGRNPNEPPARCQGRDP